MLVVWGLVEVICFFIFLLIDRYMLRWISAVCVERFEVGGGSVSIYSYNSIVMKKGRFVYLPHTTYGPGI